MKAPADFLQWGLFCESGRRMTPTGPFHFIFKTFPGRFGGENRILPYRKPEKA